MLLLSVRKGGRNRAGVELGSERTDSFGMTFKIGDRGNGQDGAQTDGPKPNNEQERRTHTRYPVNHSAKVFHAAAGRYVAAKVCDVSSGGALLRVEGQRVLLAGEEIEVYVAWGKRVVLDSSDGVRGRVVRSVRGVVGATEQDGETVVHSAQFVAVEFAEAQPLAVSKIAA